MRTALELETKSKFSNLAAMNYQTTMEGISEEQIQEFIIKGLEEDVQDGDHTSLACVDPEKRDTSYLFSKDEGVIAGIPIAERIFKHLDPSAEMKINLADGSAIHYKDVVFELNCNSQALLKGERLALNLMQRLSGIATMSDRFVAEIEGTDVTILDTRKTTPLLRFLEKYAVRVGGCTNYRDGLYDRIMIKDNHIDACGSIPKAITKANNYLQSNNKNLEITIEVRNLVELNQVLETGQVNRIMLDNFELPLLREAISTIGSRFESEASGGVDLFTVREIAKTGVNFISVGALTHSAGSLDLSLKVQK